MLRTTRSLVALSVAGLLIATAAHADEHTDVDKLLGNGQYAEAVQRADQYIAAHPRDARMRFLKGLAQSEQGRTPEAIATFVKLTEDFPELPEPYNNLAVLYGKQGQYDQARRSLEAAIRTNPSYATAYENLGDVYAKLASQAYARALQMEGVNNSKVTPKLAMIRDLFAPQNQAALASATKPAAPTKVAAAPPPAAAPAAPPSAPAPAPKAAAPAPAVVIATSAPIAKPAATPPPAAVASSSDGADAQAAVQAWAAAWSRKDVDAYLAAYTADFNGGKSRQAWEEERRARIVGKRSISVTLSDFDTKVQGDKAVVQFRQNYSADTLKVSSRKTLQLVRSSGRWLIQKESTGS